jgi:hypothetical protein
MSLLRVFWVSLSVLQSPFSREVRLVDRIPRSNAEVLKACPDITKGALGFCEFSGHREDFESTFGAVGAPYESFSPWITPRRGPVRYGAAVRIKGRLSYLWITERGRPEFSRGQNALKLADGASVIVSLGVSTARAGRQKGLLVCVRTTRPLTTETGRMIAEDMRSRLGQDLMELRIRSDGWFVDTDFTLWRGALNAWNEERLPSKAELESRRSVYCAGPQLGCTVLKGLAFEKLGN